MSALTFMLLYFGLRAVGVVVVCLWAWYTVAQMFKMEKTDG